MIRVNRGWCRYVRSVTTLLVIVALAACGTENSTPIPSPVRSSEGFSLAVSPQCLLEDSSVSGFKLDTLNREHETLVSISAVGATDLKALYFELGYDADRFNPVEVTHLEALAGETDLITLDILQDRGIVRAGQLQANWDQTQGFSGDAVLVTVRFMNGPAPATKILSGAPTSAASASVARLDEPANTLHWDFGSQGDYDQNSEVNLADLTPLGLFFRAVGPFPREDVRSQVDGDGNGEINLADVTPIGNNFLNTVVSYNVYGSLDDTDYPAAAEDVSTIEPLGSVAFSEKLGTPSQDRLTYNYDISGSGMTSFWVRPVSGENEGIASNLALRGDLPGILLSITNPPDIGAGTGPDPYHVDVDTNYYLTVTLPGEIDVSIDPLTVFTVSDNAAGQVAKPGAQAVFNVDDAFSGLVSISVEFDGEPTIPQALYFRVISAETPLLILLNDPGEGIGSAGDPFIVGVTTNYIFGLFSLLGGSVGGDALTAWNVSDPAAGSILKGTENAALNILDDYTGTFSVGAVYDGYPSDPLALYLRVPDADSPALTLETLSQGGSGYEWDPYQVNNSIDYNLGLVHQILGDVGSHTDTVWAVSNPLAGGVNTAGVTAVLELASGFEDVISVGASYNGSASTPALLWFEVFDTTGAIPPIADLLIREKVSGTDVSGSTTNTELELTFDATGSSDSDGTIEFYNYDFYGSGGWDIEDSTSPTMSHTYFSTGVYDTRVQVRDNDGAIDIATVRVTVTDGGNFYPEVHLTADPLTGEVPLTVNFDASASTDDKGIVQFTWDLDGDDVYETETGPTPTTSHHYTEDGVYLVSVKGYDIEGEWDFAEVELILTQPGGNLSPIASLSANPVFGLPGLDVSFNAGDSSDPNGDVLTFEWDWEGDGTYNHNSGTTATAAHIYDVVGTYPATVKVSDPSGAFDTASVTITIDDGTATWHIYEVAVPDGTVVTWSGTYVSLRVVDGLPAIAYQDTVAGVTDTKKRMMYSRALDTNGETWGTPVLVREPQFEQEASGVMCDLEIVNGNPAISYAEYEWDSATWHYSLRYSRATDATGTAWNASQQLDGNGTDTAGRHNDLAVVNGNPAIAYLNGTTGDLRYLRATDAPGNTWGAPVIIETLESGSPSGLDTSLLVVDDRPAVAYMYWMSDINEDQLHFSRATDTTGASWGSPLTLDTRNNVGFSNKLLIHGGVPVLGAINVDDDEVLFYTAADAGGAAWDLPQVAVTDPPGGLGGLASGDLAVHQGLPVVCYIAEGDWSSTLKFARSTTADGSAWQSPETIESIGLFGSGTSLTIVNDHPAIAYGDEVDNGKGLVGSVKYAIWY